MLRWKENQATKMTPANPMGKASVVQLPISQNLRALGLYEIEVLTTRIGLVYCSLQPNTHRKYNGVIRLTLITYKMPSISV